ncbi:hypothetical protein JG688_00018336 [Phytophthora aleatoria]|uniref:Uncharacterized protein n=1 Tax=Phytophthora aleatoria TaxID=2496075 RepID=A0A8J5LUS6_9STRA|nr:hypothetical protein JG688_00018336 [Phytophthora aleatoria]
MGKGSGGGSGSKGGGSSAGIGSKGGGSSHPQTMATSGGRQNSSAKGGGRHTSGKPASHSSNKQGGTSTASAIPSGLWTTAPSSSILTTSATEASRKRSKSLNCKTLST